MIDKDILIANNEERVLTIRRLLVAAVVLSLSTLQPAAALASSLTHQYARLHDQATEKFGYEVVGRDIARYGQPLERPLRLGGLFGIEVKNRPATRHELRASIDRMRAWLAPPPTPVRVAQSTSSTSSGGGSGGAEQFASCESGGSYTASNPSGAYGKYQIMPLHYSGSGVCVGLGKSPAEQDTCAGRIMESQGSGAWSQCGG